MSPLGGMLYNLSMRAMKNSVNGRIGIPSHEDDMEWQKRQARTHGVGCLSVFALLLVGVILCAGGIG